MTTNSRESWLLEAVEIMREWFQEHDSAIPDKVRVSVGFAKGQRKSTIGVCYASRAASDGVHQLFMSPVMDEPVKVLATLLHELVHAADDCKSGHRGEFARLARALGLEGKLTATVPGDALTLRLKDVAGKLGEYAHAALNPLEMGPVQKTRMIKIHAPKEVCCGMILRTTEKWLTEVGYPSCPHGVEMVRG